jgi:hypothetical protein
MLYKALASAIMGSVLNSVKKEAIETAKSQLLKNSMEKAREAMLAHVAEQYSREVEHNISEYVRALADSNVEVSFEGKPGEALIMRAESAIDELEGYLDAQNPDGAVIQFLKRRYSEEGVRIISGRLYAGHYVNRTGQGKYEVLNRMGYAAAVDKRKPWLTGNKTVQGVQDIISQAAVEMFELMFDNVDLSGELASLKVSGEGAKKAKQAPKQYTEKSLSGMTRDQLKEIAGTKRNISKKELIAKILKK